MFPSEDPFAYPNQPLITLESGDYIKQEQEPSITSATFNPPTSAEYEGTRDPILNEMPIHPWIPVRRPQGVFTMTSQGSINASDDNTGQEAIATSHGGQGWQEQQQAQSGFQGMSVDQLFGEDWGGWMNQGYR